MIPIPKNKKHSLCNSNKYWVIALSSILSKILDWVILIKEGKLIMLLTLHLGLKKGCPQRRALIVC